MTHGGSRPGAGRKEGVPSKKKIIKEAKIEARASGLSPLDYMLAVMNDNAVDARRRDLMAQVAAPYVHGKAAETALGKKEQSAEAAKLAAVGRFAAPAPPKGK